MDGSSSEMELGNIIMQSTSRNIANRRRFSDQQIKFLEFMFETESRPESQIKQQLANELGLQPRQISIWFQNRRARLKTKQVEREYNKLKASHDALASSFDSLKKENQSLLIQLQKLKKRHADAKQQETSRNNYRLHQNESNSNQRIERRDGDYESKEKPSNLMQQGGCSSKESMVSNNAEERKNIEKSTDRILNLTDGSITSSDWDSCFESNSFLEESSCSSQWWKLLA